MTGRKATVVAPDDDVYRVNAVWLGPRGFTFPWTARYQAYAVWLGMFLLVLAVERVTPLTVGTPPVWEVCVAVLATYLVMGFVDHERPVGAVARTLWADLTGPRRERPRVVVVTARVTRSGGGRRGRR